MQLTFHGNSAQKSDGDCALGRDTLGGHPCSLPGGRAHTGGAQPGTSGEGQRWARSAGQVGGQSARGPEAWSGTEARGRRRQGGVCRRPVSCSLMVRHQASGTRACTHLCAHMHSTPCTHACTHVHSTLPYTCVHTLAHTHTHTLYSPIHTHAHACTQLSHTHACILTHTRAHTHAHACTRLPPRRLHTRPAPHSDPTFLQSESHDS